MASAIDYDTLSSMPLMEQLNTLTEHISPAEQMELAMDLLNGLKAVLGGAKATTKPKATAKPKASSTEPKALTGGQQTWRDGLTYVWNTVKETDPKFSYKNAMKFASTLKTHADWPAPPAAAVKKAYTAWLAENPPSETASVASAGSKTSGSSSKKLADMSEDEKKTYYKARAAKAAATRAANKASAGGSTEAEAVEPIVEAPKPIVEAPKPVVEAPTTPLKATTKPSTKRATKAKEPVVEDGTAYEWKHDFGNGMTAYERVNNDGMGFLFDLESKDYLGAYNEKTNAIDTEMENPFQDE